MSSWAVDSAERKDGPVTADEGVTSTGCSQTNPNRGMVRDRERSICRTRAHFTIYLQNARPQPYAKRAPTLAEKIPPHACAKRALHSAREPPVLTLPGPPPSRDVNNPKDGPQWSGTGEHCVHSAGQAVELERGSDNCGSTQPGTERVEKVLGGGDTIKKQRTYDIVLSENTSPIFEKLRVDDPTRRNFFGGDITKKTRIMQYYLRNTSPVCEKLRVDDPTRRFFFRGRHHQKTRIMQYYLGNMLLLREKFCIDDPTRRNAFGGDIIKNQRACHIILVENTGAVCEKLCIDVRTRRNAFGGDNTKKHRACHILYHQQTLIMQYYDNALLCQWETWSLFARSCTSPFELVASFSGGHHQKVQAMQYYLGNTVPIFERWRVDI
ncbi:uncharacterized protein LACBIDRAFT_334927 [Laccaria bicolor S238N-H82]|uniref:Predicted protein n=1 Tax=Laccaria bicolor (strain S238N-H82 / ATCC MYA-4686) TaxID=486041 RepID=B0E0S8_LACBS|nr:uncharacterized protein LACBIDRAFT_334927 [Laccaria bicolor S238N-H82]EDQ99578.1 predicted protein [Laccaria bicolor S238N-H82]|eukprot:XP_001889802.1 predicted protein [Laccaria bicolor S238N-H82]